MVAIFFAETGSGLETCQVHQVREWHFPLCLAKSILGRRKLHLSVDKGDVSVSTDGVESDVKY